MKINDSAGHGDKVRGADMCAVRMCSILSHLEKRSIVLHKGQK